jgi:hypothetical protein
MLIWFNFLKHWFKEYDQSIFSYKTILNIRLFYITIMCDSCDWRVELKCKRIIVISS